MKQISISRDDNGLVNEHIQPGMFVTFSFTLEDDTVFTDEGVIVKAIYNNDPSLDSYIVSGKKGKTEIFSRDIDTVYSVRCQTFYQELSPASRRNYQHR